MQPLPGCCPSSAKRMTRSSTTPLLSFRGLLYLLVDQRPSLLSHLQKYDHAGVALFRDKNARVALSDFPAEIIQDPASESVSLVIDALDECIDDEDRAQFLKFLVQQLSVGSRTKWIVSSRNWPQIEELIKGRCSACAIPDRRKTLGLLPSTTLIGQLVATNARRPTKYASPLMGKHRLDGLGNPIGLGRTAKVSRA